MRRHPMTSLALLATLGLGLGCAELPVLEPDTCGNGVLEGGEDCDIFANGALGDDLSCGETCRYECDPRGGKPACPIGWACGNDGTCRFGASEFVVEEDSPLPFAAPRILLGDVDADGTVDVVGGNAASVSVRFGSSSGDLREPFSLASDFPIAPRALAHVGEGMQLDLLSPTIEGVDVFFGDEARRLVPAGVASMPESSIAPTDSGEGVLVGLRAPGKSVDDLVVVSVDESQLVVFTATSAPRPVTLGPAPGAPVAPVHPVQVDGHSVVAVAAQGGGVVHVLALSCAPAADCSGVLEPRPRRITEVSVAHLGRVRSGVRLADVNGDGQLDLLADLLTSTEEEALALALGLPDGGFARAELPWASSALCAGIAGDCWPLAVGDVDGEGGAELVLRSGLWSIPAGRPFVPVPVSLQVEPQGAAEMLDVNGDGRLDVVMAAASRSVVQVLLNSDGLFNTATMDVGRRVRMMRRGDFDGDGIDDLAIVQDTVASAFGAPRDVSDVSVLFGATSGGLGAPELMARFLPIALVVAARLPSRTVLGDDAISDLVVQVEADGQRRVGFMVGTGQGRLHAPIRLPFRSRSLTSLPAAVLGLDVDQDGGRDLVAVTYADEPGSGDGPLVYLSKEMDGTYDLDAATPLSPEATCLTPEALGRGCLEAAVGTLDGIYGVLAVNQRDDCLSPFSVAASMVTMLTPHDGTVDCHALPLQGTETWTRPGPPRFADVDGDGAPDAFVLFRGDEQGGRAGLAVWSSVDARPRLVPGPEGRTLFDVAALDVDGDVALEVAVLAVDGVYVLDDKGSGLVWLDSPTLSMRLPVDGSASLGAADLDGDGLEDLLVGTEDRLSVFRAQQSWLGGRPP